ncbi:MAG: Gfo/Idh/MocA family oxidoreductase [Defluviitaleaceae bacterium]|nr:Gfo/Idh/MocA family oxidoreductase [Defluviitaleaceae bacterium]MCL2262263.1 Gfo/Idh/MocA family oxidoreductase [Defluviitaleaceae bacterium]
MQKLKAGIIGCGGIAKQKHMPNIIKTELAEMVAFCDNKKERAEKSAKEFGAQGAKVYTNYEEILQDKSIDVIYVLTPNKSHSAITIAALEAGKHVMCEKPMAKTSAEARAMLETAKRTGKILTIAYQNRFKPEAAYIKKCIERGDLGDIYFAKAHALRRRAVPTWGVFLNEEEQGGGPLIDIGTHALDLTLWFMDKYKPKSVMGSVYHKLNENGDCGNAFGEWNPKEFTVEDSAFGFITMEDNSTIVLESSWALNILDYSEAKATVCGTKGGADMQNGVRINGDDLGRLYEKSPLIGKAGVDFFEGNTIEPALQEQFSFLNAITKGTPLTVLPEQALAVTEILEAIYESAKTGKLVTF